MEDEKLVLPSNLIEKNHIFSTIFKKKKLVNGVPVTIYNKTSRLGEWAGALYAHIALRPDLFKI